MTTLTRRRITLTMENVRLSARMNDMEAAAQQHQATIMDLETSLHKSESELTRMMRAIANDQADFNEKSNELSGQIDCLTKDYDDALWKVSHLTRKLNEARLKADRCPEEWLQAWQESDKCLAYNAEVGESSYQDSEVDAMARMRRVVSQE